MEFRKIIKICWDEFVYGGHLLSLGASAIVLSATVMLDQRISIPLLVICYLIAQIVYTFNHYKELKGDIETNPERATHLEKLKGILPFIIIFYISLLIFLLVVFSNIQTILFVFFLAILGLLYPKNLTKKIIGFKNLYVSFFWALASASLPYFFFSINLSSFFYLFFLFVLMRWLLNTIYFDLKDIDGDEKDNLKTIPVVIGVNKTLRLLFVCNLFSGVFVLYAIYTGVFKIASAGLLATIIYSAFYLYKTKKLNSEEIRKVSYIMVDGEYLLWPLLLALTNYFLIVRS